MQMAAAVGVSGSDGGQPPSYGGQPPSLLTTNEEDDRDESTGGQAPHSKSRKRKLRQQRKIAQVRGLGTLAPGFVDNLHRPVRS